MACAVELQLFLWPCSQAPLLFFELVVTARAFTAKSLVEARLISRPASCIAAVLTASVLREMLWYHWSPDGLLAEV